ncbi:alpha-1,2-fucosyltransferase [Aquabacterium sp. A3]|uniref:alpha-1,2-fucosyltransferase n=1 Tax=Aquabacterium sp. A3 TaxID=3132829 RepID=UPI003119BA83
MATDRALLHFPVLSRADFLFFRLLGPGLGNLLFPMYRAFQAQRLEGGQLVFPQFFQWKPGPWLRREKDARAYGDLFRHRTPQEVLLHAKAVALRLSGHAERLRVQEGLGRHFHDLDAAHQATFKQWLVDHYRHREALMQELASISAQDICVHIRRGDFAAATTAAAQQGTMNYQIPDEWYVDAVRVARQSAPGARVRVFTDAHTLEPALMAALGADEVDASPNALHSMLRMSAHGTIVTSRSSFSLWAAYLGSGQAIVHRDFDLGRYMPDHAIRVIRC